MLHFDNCRTFGSKFNKPTDILINSLIVWIDYACNAYYWVDRLGEKQIGTATDRDGNRYNIFRNEERELMVAIPIK